MMSDPAIGRSNPAGPYHTAPSPRGAGLVDEIVAGLRDPAEGTYLRALARLSTRRRTPEATTEFLVTLVGAFTQESSLTERARAERLTAVIRRLNPDRQTLEELATAARAFPAGMRMSVAQVLPPELRALLTAAGTPTEDSAQLSPNAPEDVPATPPRSAPTEGTVAAAAAAHPRAEGTDGARFADGTEAGDGTIGMIAILSHAERQDGNKAVLHRANFAAVPWDSVEKFCRELATNTDVCGCVIDGSVMRELDVSGQRQLFEYLGGYSSFLWIRVHDDGLKIPQPEVRDLVKDARCARGTVAHLSFQGDSHLRPAELDDFRRAAGTLRSHTGASFVPGELDQEQAQLLVAAVREFWTGHQLGGEVLIHVLETRFISGGRSGAITVRIRVNSAGQPLIAKLGPRNFIIEESRRLRTFIESWNRALHPETFLHCSWGVILFGLVATEGDRDEPADTLEERLTALWNDQVMRPRSDASTEDWQQCLVQRREALSAGLRSLTNSVKSLNRQRPSSEFEPYGNPWVSPLDRLEEENVRWYFGNDVRTARRHAQHRIERLAKHAVVHGDLHLRNVLLRGDRDAHLIDFASCGPGHPSADLARLDVVLFTDGMRQLVSEARCTEFQRALTIERASSDTLLAAFTDLLACHVNIVCAEGAVLARDSALSVLEEAGGDYDDYLAVKYLVASQALLQMGRATGMARAIIDAMTPTVLSWSDTSGPGTSIE